MAPFAVLGTALLIRFRTPSSHVGYLVMCQLLNGAYSGVWSITARLAIMASVTHQEIAVAIALWSMFASIGGSVGSAIAGALWTNIVPDRLYHNLPDELKNRTSIIFGDIEEQLKFPMGSPAREAIIEAFGHVQRLMVIVGCSFLPICIVCLMFWRNIDVRKVEGYERRKKGNVL